MVLRELCSLSSAAVAFGVPIALLVTRFLSPLLFGIAPSDPGVVWGSTALVMLVAVGASWLPAWRAASVQPVEALRREG
jgi:ABC-type antimicrobial peptide transport system permease subunit